ncbi:hypothetical protein F4009_06105 [Candidatus Poribacteria bacterium]|nr:hypothetical protein [Candidatus Poribacteria bacterium]MYH81041.1 hypothetical protein [Candidatus Poribacteria bacterium]MYK93562.1 hypothetical protein [Candidatus Poribacteria bacterium]
MKTAFLLSFFIVSVAFGAVEIEDVEFGFNEGYKTGTWAPLTITVGGQDAFATSIGIPGQRIAETYLAVEVRSFSNTPTQRYATPLTGLQRKNFYIYCPKNATELVIELGPAPQSGNTVSQDKVRRVMQEITLPTPLARKDFLVLVLAPSGDKLKRFIHKKQLAAHDDAQVHVAYRSDPTSLPRAWIGYSAVDVLVIREIVLRRISKAQQTAILDWVQRGGTLIVSGGSNYKYLRDSFIEPFLPVELKKTEQTEKIPAVLHEQLGFRSFGSNSNPFERIPFSPKPECETLIGTDDQIYVAMRNFGDGQILCLAFDYNATPFSEQQVGETFWNALLSKHGKSPRHFTDRYALALQHEEKIYQQFLSTSIKAGSTQVPLIKLLAIVLPIYLLSFGSFLFYFGRSQKSRDHDHSDGVLQQKRKARIYWIGGLLFVLLSLSTIAVARNVLPNSVTADQLSILSVYPDRNRVHLQSYISVRTTAHTETSIDFAKGNFIRHQETESPQKIGTLIQSSGVQLRGLPVEPWHPTTYVQETFLDAQELPRILENAWHVTGKEMTYLDNVTLDSELASEFSLKSGDGVLQPTAVLRRRVTPALPPDEGLRGRRKWFAQILRQEQVLRHLVEERGAQSPPYLIGWTSHNFTDTVVTGNVNTNNETLVILPIIGL